MVYEVYLDGRMLYYPSDDVFALSEATLDLQLSQAGEFSFTIPACNPLYGDVHVRQSMVQVLGDGREVFYGEVREIEETMDGMKNVYVVGELAFLYDSIQPQGRFQNITAADFFRNLLSVHNDQVEAKKRFEPGIITISDEDSSVYRYTNHEDTLTDIRDKLCDRMDGYLRIRKANGVRYLDLITLEEYGKRCSQPISFGSNLLDYCRTVTGEGIATVVIPLGAMLEESPYEVLYAYTDITSVNDGKEYLELPEAIERFGRITRVVEFSDIKTPKKLKEKGMNWLVANQYEELIIDVDAVDLSEMNADMEGYEVGDFINLQADWEADIWLPLQQKHIDLLDSMENKISIGYNRKGKFTDADASFAVMQELNALQQAQTNGSNRTAEAIRTAEGATAVAGNAATAASDAMAEAQRVAREVSELPEIPKNVSAFTNDAGYAKKTDIPPKIIPLDSVSTGGTQFINTGIVLTQEHAVEMEFELNAMKANQVLFGSRQSATANNFSVLTGGSTGNLIYADFGNYQVNRAQISGLAAGTKHKIKVSREGTEYDGVMVKSFNTINFTTPGTCYVAFRSGDGGGISIADIKIYRFRIWKNGELVMCLIPCENMEGQRGMYDLITGVYYYDQEGGDLN